jgi:hypothetical protein
MQQDSTARLLTPNLQVFMTREVVSAKADVNPRTFEKYVEPAALRLGRGDKISALYTEESIEAFRRVYTVSIEQTGGSE